MKFLNCQKPLNLFLKICNGHIFFENNFIISLFLLLPIGKGLYQRRIKGGVLGSPTLFRNFFQLARVFKKIFPKFSIPYKKISKPLPRKISGFAPGLYIYHAQYRAKFLESKFSKKRLNTASDLHQFRGVARGLS